MNSKWTLPLVVDAVALAIWALAAAKGHGL